MSWTKRQFIEQAYEEIGYAAYTFDIAPEKMESALRRMDSMMAEWNGMGIRVGYPLPDSPEDSDLDQKTDVPDAANAAIYCNLGVRLAPTVGKEASRETKQQARTAYKTLLLKGSNEPNERRLPSTMPLGAGNKPWRNDGDEFIDDQKSSLDAGGGGELDFTS